MQRVLMSMVSLLLCDAVASVCSVAPQPHWLATRSPHISVFPTCFVSLRPCLASGLSRFARGFQVLALKMTMNNMTSDELDNSETSMFYWRDQVRQEKVRRQHGGGATAGDGGGGGGGVAGASKSALRSRTPGVRAGGAGSRGRGGHSFENEDVFDHKLRAQRPLM